MGACGSLTTTIACHQNKTTVLSSVTAVLWSTNSVAERLWTATAHVRTKLISTSEL